MELGEQAAYPVAGAGRYPAGLSRVENGDLVFHDTVDPSSVTADSVRKGTAPPAGKCYEQTCISVVRTDDDGLITHCQDSSNPLVAIEALTSCDVPSHSGRSVTFGG
ncbi:hypothetical protein [Streptomyces chartreusis]|uniref:hypothetical protein n=1 Tax=Streptomyces chartreusis TaxID=1969 RepID=UPI003864C29D|nr:hypothetical protein OG938_47430 [Streptomyces chartreusis]WTA33774.1 hypothetical protein OIA45_48010 [Streptomyces chartreusis]